jgi:cell division protein FtsI (penicillin-binding protein 3)
MIRRRPSLLDPLRATERPGEGFEAGWRLAVKRRIVIILSVLVLWAAGIEARLVQLQVFQHDDLMERADNQQQSVVPTAAMRGDIVDRHGQVLAYSVDASSIIAHPRTVKDPQAVLATLCDALGDCTAAERRDFAERLAGRKPFHVRRARAVSPEQAARVQALKLPAFQLVPETLRYYPKFDLAAHVLGFVDPDNKGLAGVERAFDGVIRGQEGLLLAQVDARKQWMQTRVERAPTAGATVELTLDLNLQYIAERELRAGVEENRARAGTAIIMDPRTGEILALANYPTFNPNSYGRSPAENWRNRAVQDTYEPGSTFKIVTASAALEEGVVSPTDIIDCSPGYITFPGRDPIKDTHPHGSLTFEDVIVLSSNVGAIKTGLKVGADRLARYVRRFGFGEALGTDFKGESAGKVWSPAGMSDSALASMSIGYQVSVTPLQMAMAASAVANGGTLLEPHVVRAIVRNGVRQDIPPKALRQAIDANTAATLTTFMEEVVKRGTATAARLDRYQVAGKTGTTEKLVDGRYSKTDYNASFVGFVPSRRPALTILVVIDTPRAGHIFGGDVAAPIFKRIADAALLQEGVPPTVNPVPPVLTNATTVEPAVRPARATVLPAISTLGASALMPDLRGLSARDALRILGGVGLNARVTGDGFVVSQIPAPGEAIEPGGWSTLQLRRAPLDPPRGPGRDDR